MAIYDSQPSRSETPSDVPTDYGLVDVDILGVRVCSGSTDNVISLIDARQQTGATTRIAFLNAHLSNVGARDAELRAELQDFIVLNDGVGVDIARRVLYGARFPENLNGTDFTTEFLDRTAHDLRIFLLGARPEVIQRAAGLLSARWPRHVVVGFHHGFITQADEEALAAAIAKARPDLVLVGTGNPRQERWIARNIPRVGRCAMAVGAWFDFMTGAVPRAPQWVRRARAEWLYRFWREPRRLARRYLIGNFVFIGRVAIARMRPGSGC